MDGKQDIIFNADSV